MEEAFLMFFFTFIALLQPTCVNILLIQTGCRTHSLAMLLHGIGPLACIFVEMNNSCLVCSCNSEFWQSKGATAGGDNGEHYAGQSQAWRGA